MSNANSMRFDGKVALITGAGGGLGKEYALAFADRGAKVVVNDLGGDIKGGGKSRAADKVVDEIRARGGTAVANYDSVENGDAVVKTAIDNYGRVDIVVNNAGILRDKSFGKTSDLDWDLIHRVHLRGSFMVTRAAWPHMRAQKYGRIIMTASAAGIYGNFGQANYSSAKLGLLGLSNTLSLEGRKYNINCNTLAPIAGSRLTQTVMPQELIDALKPEYVAPITLYLCHDSCDETGSLFECGGGYFAKLRDAWDRITDFDDGPLYPGTIGESSAHAHVALQKIEEDAEKQPPKSKVKDTGKIQPDVAIGQKFEPTVYEITDRAVILYALGVGVSTSQPGHLEFLYEGHESFRPLPTLAVIAAAGASRIIRPDTPGLPIDPTKILHGEQYLELYKPMPTSGKLTSQGMIADVLDKGKGALIITNVETFDESGEKVAFNQFSTFVQRAGGFGGKRSSDRAIPAVNPPKRTPDASVTEKTTVDQAALYRLSGDRNPLHIDPSFAAMGGFQQPILHGLASFGYATRHVLQTYAGNDVTKFKAIKVRFSAPVLPGESLRTEMWREGNRIHFECKVVESGKTCLSGAYVDLHSVTSQGSSASATAPTSSDVHSDGELMTDVAFAEIARHVEADPSMAKRTKAVFVFVITKDGAVKKTWTVDLLNGAGAVYVGEPKPGVKAGVTVTVSDDDFIKMASGELNGQKAFLTGKLKLKGNIMLAQKLNTLFQAEQSKL